jgi:putative N6-adenine-specific DNA methylase
MAMSSSSSTTNSLFVTCPTGLEPLLIEELSELGIEKIRRSKAGVFVPQDISLVYRINYCSRLATRVLWPLMRFPCPHPKALYQGAKEIDPLLYLSADQTFAIDANVSHPLLRNSLYAAQVVKDALCDTFKQRCGRRPSINVSSPDVQFNLFIEKGLAILSLDTSLQPLYKRGYRQKMTQAPLQETLAAALLRKIGYSAENILCDPFCGSGTFLIEAALMATKTPPGFFRKKWGFFQLPEFSEAKWQALKLQCDQKMLPLPRGHIFGADIDPQTVEICRHHVKNCGWETAIDVSCRDIRKYWPDQSPTLILTNPPYGRRSKSSIDVFDALAHFVKKLSLGSDSSIFLLAEKNSTSLSRLPVQSIYSFYHGGASVTLYQQKN